MQNSQSLVLETTPSWTMPRQRKEMKRLKVMIEARFLFISLRSEKVEFGAFLSKFREVGDAAFAPQRIRTLDDDILVGSSM